MPSLHTDAAVLMMGSGLRNLDHLLACAQQEVEQSRIGESALVQARLASDMLPLSAQIAMVCNGAVQRMAILAATPRPPVVAEPASLLSMRQMSQQSASYIEGLAGQPWTALDDARVLQVDFPAGFPVKTVAAYTFLRQAVLPNFYFHLCMAYALLRQQGVPIGKLDYLYGDRAPARQPPPVA